MKRYKFGSIFALLCVAVTVFTGLWMVNAAGASLNDALNAPGGSLSFVNDAAHPWVTDSETDPGRISARSDIAGIAEGMTTFTLDAGALPANKVLSFDWNVSSETGHDSLYFIVNGTPRQYINGQSGDWAEYVYVTPQAGNYTFSWTYSKDYAVNSGEDCAWVDNVKISNFIYVQDVAILPEETTVYINFAQQLEAVITPQNATIQDVLWESDNTAVATVDENGIVTGVSQGTAVITATSVDGYFVGSCEVTVPPAVPVTGVSIDYSQGTLAVGKSGKLTATIAPQYASNRNIGWSSSNTDIAVVTDGTVTAVSPGVAIITAVTQDGNFADTCEITVLALSSIPDQSTYSYTPKAVNTTTPVTFGWNISDYLHYDREGTMTLTTGKGYSVWLEAGRVYNFETEGTLLVDTYLNLYNSSFAQLAYDDDSGEASFSHIENYTAPYTGTYYILVSGYSTSSAGTFDFHFTQIPPVYVTGVAFAGDTASVAINKTIVLEYAVLPAEADLKGVNFSSANTGIATVSANGTVTGVSPGTTTVTVTTVDGGFTDTCTVNVTYTPVTSVACNTDGIIVGLNKTKAVRYTIEPAAAEIRGVTFSSSNTSVATVSANGTVTGKAIGNAVITVTTVDGGKTDTCSVMVVQSSVSNSAMVTLIAGDIWGDGTGYQMLLDADATAYGTLFQKSGGLNASGNVPASVYSQFESKIPENADGTLTTTNIVFNAAVSVLIPAGTYDYCITNPVPGDRVWIVNTSASSPGRYNDFVFEPGYSYTFTIGKNPVTNRDYVTLAVEYTGAGLSEKAVDYSVTGTGGVLTGKTHLQVDEGYVLTAADVPAPTPDVGYHFVSWNANPVGAQANDNLAFSASFSINLYTVIFKDYNNTTLKVQQNIPHGSPATAPPEPNNRPYWHFVGWNKSFSGVTGNLTVTAVYEIDSYAVNLPTGSEFTAQPEGTSSSPVPRGGNFSFTVTLSPNYSNSTITVKANGTVLTAIKGVYTIANITEPKTVTVEGLVLNDADYTALDTALALTPAYADVYYTTATINAFRNALANGQAVPRNYNVLSQSIIDSAAAAINTAYANLTLRPANYGTLDVALALEPSYNAVYYTQESLQAYYDAVAAGEALPRDLTILSQSQIDNTAYQINIKFNALTLKLDPVELILNSASTLTIDKTKDLLLSVAPGSTVDAVLSEFANTDGVIAVEGKNGTVLAGSAVITTGTKFKLLNKDGNAVDVAEAVVRGDTDCNGIVDGADAPLAYMIAGGMLNESSAGYAVYAAADYNSDGAVTDADAMLIEQAGLFL